MALDYSQYLRDKFQEDFEEADKQFTQNLPLRSQLREILEYIQKEEKFSSSSVLIQMKDCFMKLNDALADCIMFVESSPQKALIGSSSSKILPSVRPCKDYWLLIKTWLRLRSIRREMESKGSDLGGEYDREETYPFIYAITSAEYYLEYPNHVKYYGLDKQAKAIQDFLAQGKQAIGIVGMGGSGKTALARKVLLEMRANFQGIMWINLTEATDLDKEYSVTIMETYLNRNRRKSTFGSFLSDLQNNAVDYICQHEKTLIVVDGVWHATDDIKSFTHTVLNRENVAMIVTSRMGGVAKNLVPDTEKKFYLHRMEPLKEEDCWSIFVDSIKRKQLTPDVTQLRLEETEVFAKIKNEIMEKSSGLPLAAKTLAEVFSIRLEKEEFWTDPDAPKAVVLRVEADPQTLVNLIDKLDPITRRHYVDFEEMRLFLITHMDPVQLVKELGPFYHTELISVHDIHPKNQRSWPMLKK